MGTYEISQEVLSRELDGEAVLLDLRSGHYFGLNGTGAKIWAGLQAGMDDAAIVASVAEAFAVDEATARADVSAFLGTLIERGLVTSVARV